MYEHSLLLKDMFIRPTLCLAALIIHPDDVQLRGPAEMFALCWDGKVPDLCYQNDDTALLVLSADIVSVDHDFLTKWKSAYSSCPYFCDEIKARWKGHGLIKSSDGLYTYHDRLVIHRPAQDLYILLLTKCHYNVDHPNWQLYENLLGGNVLMLLNCKAPCFNCVVCNCTNLI